MYDILETIERIQADNEKEAASTRSFLENEKVFFVNLMGSPGAGKTSVLLQIIKKLKNEIRIGVMEADVDSAVDAETIANAGVKVIQLHSGGLCHMDADMTRRGIDRFGVKDIDLMFLENIGNLVCPAEFDVGSDIRIMILSVPEGDDKPLKYPLMFTVSDVMIINKIDTMPVFNFNVDKCVERARKLNPNIKVFPVSARTGEGFDELCTWLIDKCRESGKI